MDLFRLIAVFGDLIYYATPVVVALALLFFLWGMALYIFAQGSEKGKGKGKTLMIWGVIALFVMVSIWGIVNMLQNTFRVGQGSVQVPQLY